MRNNACVVDTAGAGYTAGYGAEFVRCQPADFVCHCKFMTQSPVFRARLPSTQRFSHTAISAAVIAVTGCSIYDDPRRRFPGRWCDISAVRYPPQQRSVSHRANPTSEAFR